MTEKKSFTYRITIHWTNGRKDQHELSFASRKTPLYLLEENVDANAFLWNEMGPDPEGGTNFRLVRVDHINVIEVENNEVNNEQE